jgi:hypothetical protein
VKGILSHKTLEYNKQQMYLVLMRQRTHLWETSGAQCKAKSMRTRTAKSTRTN